MQSQELISLIIPVHNAERYVLACLQSLSVQSYTNFEVFLVDDGSTDSSGRICDEYAEKDGRFHVIHTTCNGPGPARNTGLEMSQGEWIAFVDSDDILHPDYLKSLMGAVKSTGTELAACEYQLLLESDSPQFQEITLSPKMISSDTAINNLFSRNFSFMVVWAKLFSRKLLEEIRFKKMMVEDTEFMSRVFPRVNQIAYTTEKLYYYYRRIRTLSQTPSYLYHMVFAYWGILEYYREYFPQYSEMAARLCLNSVINFNYYRNQAAESIRKQVDRIRRDSWGIAFPGRGLTIEEVKLWLRLRFPKYYQKLWKMFNPKIQVHE